MKLNISLKDLKGKDVLDEDKEPVMIFELIIDSLLNAKVKETETYRKTKRFILATKLTNNETKDVSKVLTAKDKVEIMDAVKTNRPPIVVGRIAEIIDPNSLKEDTD